MRILHITPTYHPALGGSETYTKEISERLALRGHDVTVLAACGTGTSEGNGACGKDTQVINGVKVRTFTPVGRLQDVACAFVSMPGVRQLLGLAMPMDKIDLLAGSPYGLRAFRMSTWSAPDVVSVINWYGGSLAYQACLARRIREFALVGIPLFHTECRWSHLPHHREMLACCDAVVAMTEHERSFIEQGSVRKHAHVTGAGVNPSVFADADGNAIRGRHGVGDAPVVGYIGRMVASKGVVTLLEAMQRVWQTAPNVRLLLAGPGLPTAADCDEAIVLAFARLSDEQRSRVICVGRFGDDEKAAIFDAVDLFAMPSVGESFGIAYLEAWARQKAVVGARIASTQCVIEHGVDGMLVAPESPEALAECIVQLLADQPTRERMGRLGYEKTIKHFTWDKIADKVETIYYQSLRTTPFVAGAQIAPSVRTESGVGLGT